MGRSAGGVGAGAGGDHARDGRGRMTIDRRIPTLPGDGACLGFHPPGTGVLLVPGAEAL